MSRKNGKVRGKERANGENPSEDHPLLMKWVSRPPASFSEGLLSVMAFRAHQKAQEAAKRAYQLRVSERVLWNPGRPKALEDGSNSFHNTSLRSRSPPPPPSFSSHDRYTPSPSPRLVPPRRPLDSYSSTSATPTAGYPSLIHEGGPVDVLSLYGDDPKRLMKEDKWQVTAGDDFEHDWTKWLDPVVRWRDAPVHPALIETLEQQHPVPTPVQSLVLGLMKIRDRKARDVVIQTLTGSGKTLAFLVPVVSDLLYQQASSAGTLHAVVILPTKELAQQLFDKAAALSARRFVVGYVSGGEEPYLNIEGRGPEILIGTVGKLSKLVRDGEVSLAGCRWFVADEVDKMVENLDTVTWQVGEMVAALPKGCRRIAATATLSQDIQRLLGWKSRESIGLVSRDAFYVSDSALHDIPRTVRQHIRYVKSFDAKTQQFHEIIRRSPASLSHVIVFAFKKNMEAVKNAIQRCPDRQLYPFVSSGGDPPKTRLTALENYTAPSTGGSVHVLIASYGTVSRGLNLPATVVVLWDVPYYPIEYKHAIGRVGRNGVPGDAFVFYCEGKEWLSREDLMKFIPAER